MLGNGFVRRASVVSLLLAADNSNYGRFRVKLLEAYPDLRNDAEQYGFEGELGNSNFVLHHLDRTTPNLIPTCMTSKKLDDSLSKDRDVRSKALNKILRYKIYLNNPNHPRIKWLRSEFSNLSDKEQSDLNTYLSKLDREVEASVLIPKNYHDNLHVLIKENNSVEPKSRKECYSMYERYIDGKLKSNGEVEKLKKKLDNFRECLEAINEMANTLKGRCKDRVYKELRKCAKKLLDIIEEYKEVYYG